jgi:hypothetical protein
VKEQNRASAFARIHLIKALTHPLRHISSIWWITEYTLSRPILLEAVLLLGVILITLMVQIIGTGVKSEMEFLVQLVKEVLRGRPVHMFAAPHHIVFHMYPLL